MLLFDNVWVIQSLEEQKRIRGFTIVEINNNNVSPKYKAFSLNNECNKRRQLS